MDGVRDIPDVSESVMNDESTDQSQLPILVVNPKVSFYH